MTVHLRGYQEAVVGDGGTLLPLVLGDRPALDICLQTLASTPTSQWEARFYVLDHQPAEPSFAPPHTRLDTTLCFRAELPPGLPATADLELCGDVRDRFDGQGFPLPCQRLRIRRDESVRRRLLAEMGESVRRGPEVGLEEVVDALDDLVARARAAGLPFLAVRLELIAVYYLRQEGTPQALASAQERLFGLPEWLERPEAGGWEAHVAYEKALLALAAGWDLRTAWQHLATADRLCLEHLNPIRLTVRMKQAEILARSGALGEAVDRLAVALADCQSMKCNERLLPNAHGALAWLLILDPQSGDQDLERAAQSLENALTETGALDDPLEHANQRIILAYLKLRRGEDPQPQLAVATGLLAASRGATVRSRLLRGWADLVAGLAAIEDGDLEQALERCGLAQHPEFPRLAAWAKSCSGQAARQGGDLEGAGEAFESAILLHEYATVEHLEQLLTLGPSQRAEAFYRAARVAVERGEVEAAWKFLARLDNLTANEAVLSHCRDRSVEQTAVRSELFHSLAALDGPASGARRRQRESIRRALRERLQELVRQQPGCAGALYDGSDGALGLRAFALDDEILLLRRRATGEVGIERRTRLPRRDLLPLLSTVAAELEHQRLDDEAWRELLMPLARALVPRDLKTLGAVTTFALHGVLQGVPLAALPLPHPHPQPQPHSQSQPQSTDAAGRNWLGDLTTVALLPSGIRGEASPPAQAMPLFVVDPRGDLAGGVQLASQYQELFPQGLVLLQGEATGAAFRRALPLAGWIHIDAHGGFDPAFPELSSLELADGPITLAELADLPTAITFANLSGCRTGSWPITADRGRFGIAGLFVRRGAGWVVASRSQLDDRLAAQFNHVFYQELAAGQTVPQAYAQALGGLRQQVPAASWSSFFLLRGGEGGKEDSP